MKLALLGDIHGNHLALAAVLSAAQKNGVDKLLITGDIVGYYFWPGKVLELLTTWEKVVVRGNHEEMLAGARASPDYLNHVDRKYGTGLRVALNTLSIEQLDWLERLPHPRKVQIDGCSILLCHGSPWDLDQYIYPDAEEALLEKCSADKHNWVVLGHTHYPMQHVRGNTTIVNPGSVGQPRNRKPGAHWALLDTAAQIVSFRVESYDAGPVIKAARNLQPDIPYLANVLSRK